jgi:integrase/recombinase XerD
MTEGMSLFDAAGHRKYINATERELFKKGAEAAPREIRTFCCTLLYTGCRISEALALTSDRVDFTSGTLILLSLKKRDKIIYRPVPVPPDFLDTLNLVHGLKEQRKDTRTALLWDWGRTTATKRVSEVMAAAGLTGTQSTAKGLRHGFGVACIEKNIPLNLVQKWLGHADMSTTAIYVNAVGAEERNIASRLWE